MASVTRHSEVGNVGTCVAHVVVVIRDGIIGAALMVVLGLAPAASASSIINGGFETGDLAGWTPTSASTGSLLSIGRHAHSGHDAAWFGAVGGSDDSLFQTFATLPGESYIVTFLLGHGATDKSNHFGVWWDSTPLLALTNAARFNQRQYTFAVTALDTLTTLRFSGRELLDFYYLDDVSVALVPTPEPTTIALIVGGIAVAAGRRRFTRRRRAS